MTGSDTRKPRRNARYTPLDVDGPLPLDMIRGIPAITRDPLGWLGAAVEQHGDLVAFPLPRTPALLVNTASGARRVLQENHRNYSKQTVQYGSLSLVTGNGLLTSDGEPWLRHRRIMQPAFHHGGLDQVAEHTLTAAENLRQVWDQASGAPVDADAAILRAMLEVVGRTLFADDLSADGGRVVDAVDQALHVVLARARSPFAGGPLGRLPSPSRRRLRRCVATLDQVCAEVVARRRNQGISPQDGDLLAVLLRAEESAEAPTGLSDREIRDELVTLVIAGHETVASSLTWTLHLLAGAPDVQDRLHAELDQVLAGRTPRWSDLPALRYTRAVIDESLRLYPPAWVISRRSREPDQVDGVDLPAGSLVMISPWLLHRSPALWDDPLRFDPTRFLTLTQPIPEDSEQRSAKGSADGSAQGSGQSSGQGSGRRQPGYLPFGVGPRLCIGRDFALVEAVLVLAALLRDRTVSRPPGAPDPVVQALVTLRPRGGLELILTPR